MSVPTPATRTRHSAPYVGVFRIEPKSVQPTTMINAVAIVRFRLRSTRKKSFGSTQVSDGWSGRGRLLFKRAGAGCCDGSTQKVEPPPVRSGGGSFVGEIR